MNELKADNLASGKKDEALIYVVDDEPMLLELASVILESWAIPLKRFGPRNQPSGRLQPPSRHPLSSSPTMRCMR